MEMHKVSEKHDVKVFMDFFKNREDFSISHFSGLTTDTNPLVAMKILARFHVSIGECLKNIEKAMNQRSIDSIWMACHKLAGSSEIVGFKEYGQKARHLSHAIQNSGELDPYIDELKAFIVSTKKLFSDIAIASPNINFYLSK